jgi:predicted kinase
VGAVDSPTDLDLRAHANEGALDRRLQQLADGHPSSPGYQDRPAPDRPAPDRPGLDPRPPDRQGDADQVRPLTDAEHAEHVAEVRERLAYAHGAGLETHLQYTLDQEHELWTDDRDALHDEIVEYLYSRSSGVPCDGKAILAGGLPGAGKTTVLNQFAHIDLSQYMVINPDLIKKEMAERGLIPSVDGLSPLEASDLVHEEASHLAKRLANRAEADGRNVIWDFTMSKTTSIARRIESLRAAGYTRVEGVFVDIPIDVSVRRADVRHRQEHDEYRAGRGLGGRHIPESTIMKNADDSWGSGNRKNFEELKSRFDGWSRYDNSAHGEAPVLVESLAVHFTDRERA